MEGPVPIFTQPNLIDMKWHGCMKKQHYHIYLLESLIEKGLYNAGDLLPVLFKTFSKLGFAAVP